MKLLILLGFLLTIALSSASYQCGPHNCERGYVCRTHDDVCGCVPINDCHEVTLTQKVIGCWVDCGITYTQIDVTIKNNLDRDIKNIFIGTDHTLHLREPASQNIWNIVRLPNGVLTLPSYQTSINAGASYVFGFIIVGKGPVDLDILAIKY